MKVKLPRVACKRCGYKWTARTVDVRACPKCKSPYFDTPKQEGPER